MRRLVGAVVILGVATLLAGCPPAYPKCNSDENCKDHNEVCVQGQCQECAVDENCKAGFVCDANKCVPKPQCRSDGECPGGQKCRGGKCGVDPLAKGTCVTSGDCPSGQDCVEGRCGPKVESSCSVETIYFDFNEHRLTSQAQSQLSSIADCLKRQKGRWTLAGHADERGTEEYNLQLSNKRAASVKRYLVDLGVSGGDLETTGFGENRPAKSGSNEAAWAANRRVEFTKN